MQSYEVRQDSVMWLLWIRLFSGSPAYDIVQGNIIVICKKDRVGKRQLPDAFFISSVHFSLTHKNIRDRLLCEVMIDP